MRVVVTGASGNLGTALLRRLWKEPGPLQVSGVVRRPPATGSGEPYDGVEWTALELGAPGAQQRLADVLDGADAVVHLAWQIQPSHDQRLLARTNVEGTRQLLAAVAAAGVPRVVHASSVGAYSPGPKDPPVDETWPTGGVPGSGYSRDKSACERLLDAFEEEHPDVAVARMRPGLIFQSDAASEIGRYFAGPLAPLGLLRFGRVPVVPAHPRLVAQCVHADDVADAFVRALLAGARGAFNVAADPVLDPSVIAGVVGGRLVPVPGGLLAAAASATWHARLQPTDPGWVALALGAPVMRTGRVRDELGWTPSRTSVEALRELLAGMGAGVGTASPPMRRREPVPARAKGLLNGRFPGTERLP